MNQYLEDKRYKIPSNVLNGIQIALVSNSNNKGIRRAKFMLNNGYLTYQALKRLKNFFDYFNTQTGDPNQFNLAGGQLMKAFIETTLNQDRAGVARSKNIRRDVNSNTNNSELKPQQTPRLNEAKKKEKDKNAVAVIVNNDNKILLLKRSDFQDQWMPDKWALVGGSIEKGESPEKACEREIKEETGLEINNFIESFSIERHADSEETVFACRYEGDDTDVELDMKENVKYGWYDISEMEFLELVPHLIEYITLVFKKYD